MAAVLRGVSRTGIPAAFAAPVSGDARAGRRFERRASSSRSEGPRQTGVSPAWERDSAHDLRARTSDGLEGRSGTNPAHFGLGRELEAADRVRTKAVVTILDAAPVDPNV